MKETKERNGNHNGTLGTLTTLATSSMEMLRSKSTFSCSPPCPPSASSSPPLPRSSGSSSPSRIQPTRQPASQLPPRLPGPGPPLPTLPSLSLHHPHTRIGISDRNVSALPSRTLRVDQCGQYHASSPGSPSRLCAPGPIGLRHPHRRAAHPLPASHALTRPLSTTQPPARPRLVRLPGAAPAPLAPALALSAERGSEGAAGRSGPGRGWWWWWRTSGGPRKSRTCK